MKKTNTFFKRMALFAIACCCSAVGFGQTQITNEADLKAIAHDLNGNYELANDIVLTEKWTPIGIFRGTFDGKGHIISGLEFNKTVEGTADEGNGGRSAGLFGRTVGATIKNLGVEGASVKGYMQVGVIVGLMDGGLIESCYVANSYVESEDHVGAIAGQIKNNAVIQNCYATAHVYSRNHQAGGLVGVFNNDGTKISKCYFSGLVRSRNNRPSGIVTLADNARPTVEKCVNLAPYILGPENLRIVASESNLVNMSDNYSLSSTRLSGNQDNYDGGTVPTNDGNYGGNKRHGANIPGGDSEAKSTSFYQTVLGWDFDNTWKILDDGYPVLKWQTSPIKFSVFNLKELYSLKGAEELDFSGLKFNQGVDFTLSTTNSKIEITGKKIKIKENVTIVSPEDVVVSIGGASGSFVSDNKINIALLPAGVIEISEAEELKYLEGYTTGSYKLVADIDMAGLEFDGLCSTNEPFKGTLDGNGYVIKNFTINTNRVGVGLINATNGATIKKLGVEGAYVKGDKRAGNIIGQMTGGTLEECYVANSYAESSDHVGALVGTAIDATVQNSYASSIVHTSNSQAGGLIGVTENTKVSKCFFSGKVSGGERANGIVALIDRSGDNMIVESCVSLAPVLTVGRNVSVLHRIIDVNNKGVVLSKNYALDSMLLGLSGSQETRSSADAASVEGADVSKTETLTKEFYESLDWNFAAGSGQWKMLADGYPVLAWQTTPVNTTLLGVDNNLILSEGQTLDLNKQIFSSHGLALGFSKSSSNIDLADGEVTIVGGNLTSKEVVDVTVNFKADVANDFAIANNIAKIALYPALIQIATKEDLQMLRENPSGNYKLTADIELTGNWTPVGTFTGTLDGNGHKISGLSYVGTNRDDVGLFSVIENATVKNLGMEGVNINIGNGKNRVGAIAAQMKGGLIEQCYVTGNFEGREDIGSIVGIMSGGAVLKDCYSKAERVHATDQEAGGLVGTIKNATIENSYFAGKASSWRNVSAIAGRADENGATVRSTVCLSPQLSSNENTPFRIINTNGKSVTLAENYSLSTTVVRGSVVELDNAAYGADKGHGANITNGDEDAKNVAFYTGIGWDFTNVWIFKTGEDYPILKKFTDEAPVSIQPNINNSQIRYSVINDVLYLTGVEDGAEVAIYSIKGQLVSVIKSTDEVNYQFLAKGVYIIKVAGEKSREIIKVINQ